MSGTSRNLRVSMQTWSKECEFETKGNKDGRAKEYGLLCLSCNIFSGYNKAWTSIHKIRHWGSSSWVELKPINKESKVPTSVIIRMKKRASRIGQVGHKASETPVPFFWERYLKYFFCWFRSLLEAKGMGSTSSILLGSDSIAILVLISFW